MNTDPKVSGGHIKKINNIYLRIFCSEPLKKSGKTLWESGKNQGILSGQKSGNPVSKKKNHTQGGCKDSGRNFDSVNIRYINFDNVKSVIFIKVKLNTSTKELE